MGDLVRDAFQASGIDEEMEKVIADAILQKWNDEHSADITSFKLNEETNNAQRSGLKTPPITSLQDLDHSGLDCAKVRLLSEQLWRRLERKYEAKLQAWKKSEQKQLDAMLEKLRSEYRESIDAKQAQYDEMTRRKEEELRRMEDRLKEENRLEFEKRLMEVQREWREIEAERRDIRTSKDQFESAKNNFALRIENEEMRLRREKDAVERMQEDVAIRARRINELIENAVSETEKRERNWIAERINEWNAREAKLTEKCERLCERVRQSGIDQNTIREQRSTIKFLQADLQACQQRLALSEGKLTDMQNKLYNVHDYDNLKEENMKLRFEIENGVTAERLKAKEVEVANLERRLKLVEEAAILRVRELKLQLKLVADKLEKKSAECRRYRLSNPPSENVVVMPPSQTEQSRQQALSLSESLSSPSTNSSSSFDRNLRNRLKNLDHLSKQLDVSLEKYRSGRHQHSRVHQRPLLTSHQMNMKATEPRRNHSEVRVAVPEVVQQDEVVVPEVMRQDDVVVPEVMPQVALSTSVKPLMTSTPLSTMDEKVTEVNVDRLTPLHETSAEAAMGNSVFPPIAFPSNKTKQNDGNKLSEQRGEILPNADVPEENSFEQRLRQRSERLRAMSAAESEQVEKQGDERSEENPVMQQYMSIITQQRQEEAEEDKAEDNSQNVDVSLEDLHMDRGEVNSASEFDW